LQREEVKEKEAIAEKKVKKVVGGKWRAKQTQGVPGSEHLADMGRCVLRPAID